MTRTEDSDIGLRVFRPGVAPDVAGHPGFGYRTEVVDGVLIERDVPVPLRDGTLLYADVFRPEIGVDVPAIVCYAPFGKHPHIDLEAAFAGSGIPVERLSSHTPFEVFDPIRWAYEGFAVCVVDALGNWYSEGRAEYFHPQEALAGYDCVEFFADQPWCNGKIGWGGVSYYAMTGWTVAAQRPPHLAANLLWDAASDNYRETNFHGGIRSALTHNWMRLTGVSLNEVEDMEAGENEHPLFDEYWQARVGDWSRIVVPTYAVTEWGNDLHLRGTIQAWRAISSPLKYLDVTGDKEWAGFYSEWAFERQRAFFGQFLLGEDNGVENWPPVRLAQRQGGADWSFRDETEFPPSRTEYRTYQLDASTGSVTAEDAGFDAATVAYDANTAGAGAVFDLRFTEDTEITGYSKVRLWVSTDASNDADLFVAYERLDAAGNVVPFVFSQMWEHGPAAFGWLRASHRELDETQSTPWQPVHLHRRRQWLVHGVPVPVDIEVWPTNIIFKSGETLRIHVRGTMIHPEPDAPFASSFLTANRGQHTIHTGGSFDSQVVLPIIPR